jgi:TonB-dependent SusC/RagA subfamily outer membrane receptor
MKNLGLLIFVFFVTAYHLVGQEKMVEGYVTTFDSIPLIKAEVKAVKSKLLVYTDSLGNFRINCLTKDKLKIDANGFNAQKIKIYEDTKVVRVDLNLKTSAKSTEIAIGYGHIQDADKLSAIASLHNKGNNFSQYANIYDLIRGQVPGVQVINDEVIIRGQNTINGSAAALIVVDGSIIDSSDLVMISPVDVKRINVLKDSAAAIYGSRGANGVVIIELKGGDD